MVDESTYRGFFSAMTVGTKELKNRLSHYLRQVREGRSIFVTDRGKVVAELRGVRLARSPEAQRLRELVERGLLEVGSGRLEDFKPVQLKGRVSLSRAILDDRE